MADFSTILTVGNDSLNLYAHSINVAEITVEDLHVTGNLLVDGETILVGDVAIQNDILLNNLALNKPVWTDVLTKKLISFTTPFSYCTNSVAVNYNTPIDEFVHLANIYSSLVHILPNNTSLSFDKIGFYSINLSCTGVNLTNDSIPFSTPSPILGVFMNLYDETDTIVTSSKICIGKFLNTSIVTTEQYPIQLASTCIFFVQQNYTVDFSITPVSTPTTFNVNFDAFNIVINYLSSV